jgi:WD40 repeat protein
LGRREIWTILRGFHRPIRPLTFSTASKTPAACGRGPAVVLWDVATGERRPELRGHTDGVQALAFSADGSLIASGGWDHSVRPWSVAGGPLGRQGLVRGPLGANSSRNRSVPRTELHN